MPDYASKKRPFVSQIKWIAFADARPPLDANVLICNFLDESVHMVDMNYGNPVVCLPEETWNVGTSKHNAKYNKEIFSEATHWAIPGLPRVQSGDSHV